MKVGRDVYSFELFCFARKRLSRTLLVAYLCSTSSTSMDKACLIGEREREREREKDTGEEKRKRERKSVCVRERERDKKTEKERDRERE